MTASPSRVRTLELDLLLRGYVQRHWRRGVMGTRVYAKGGERAVIVRNAGVDRHAPADAPVTPGDWFQRLEDVLEDLIKGAKLTDLRLVSAAPVPVPQRFLDWAKARGIRIQAEVDAPAQPLAPAED